MFCPNEAPGLSECYGADFVQIYEQYEKEGRAKQQVAARKLWLAILESQIETGSPFMLFKDSCNHKSNQKNLGTIKSSNLCTEIIQYTDEKEIAVCNLASISLPACVRNGKFDFDELTRITRVITTNLNKIIDINYYPVEQARYSNLKNRPIGIGVQGLADTFAMLRFPFASDESKHLNKKIFETIYFAALTRSCEPAQELGPYESFQGSPASQGQFQFDYWDATPCGDYDWDQLKADVKKHGIRNSLLLAPMPTASTSQILGNNECIEPFTSNMYTRRVLSGEFMVINKYLVNDLIKLDLWNETMKNKIIVGNGSIQQIEEIPTEIKDLYLTVWEIKQKDILDMAADRGAFIDQSQSLNIHMEDVSVGKLNALHFHAWKRGLKTGMYYLRTKAAADAIKFTVRSSSSKSDHSTQQDTQEMLMCSLENKDECMSCGS